MALKKQSLPFYRDSRLSMDCSEERTRSSGWPDPEGNQFHPIWSRERYEFVFLRTNKRILGDMRDQVHGDLCHWFLTDSNVKHFRATTTACRSCKQKLEIHTLRNILRIVGLRPTSSAASFWLEHPDPIVGETIGNPGFQGQCNRN